MNNGHDVNGFKVRAVDGIRAVFFVVMLACLALVVVVPAARLWAGVALITVTLIYVALDEALSAAAGRAPLLGAWGAARPETARNIQWFPTSASEVDKRLKRLRKPYYRPNGDPDRSRAVQREMRTISKPCRPYYERMMLTERSVHLILSTAPTRGVSPKNLQKQVQTLSGQIALLVEHIQMADRLLLFYEVETDEAIMVTRARMRLIRRADRAMQALEGVPARLLQLTTATSSRGLSRLVEDLHDLSTRLEGKAAAYEEMAYSRAGQHAPNLDRALARLEMEAEAPEEVDAITAAKAQKRAR